jgi:hypothetical protein
MSKINNNMYDFMFDALVYTNKYIDYTEVIIAIESNYLKDCKNLKIVYDREHEHIIGVINVVRNRYTISGICEQGFEHLKTLIENLKDFMRREYRESVEIEFWN